MHLFCFLTAQGLEAGRGDRMAVGSKLAWELTSAHLVAGNRELSQERERSSLLAFRLRGGTSCADLEKRQVLRQPVRRRSAAAKQGEGTKNRCDSYSYTFVTHTHTDTDTRQQSRVRVPKEPSKRALWHSKETYL